MEDLVEIALQAALDAGASYADVRFVDRASEDVQVKNATVDALSASESRGIGIRVIADGAWGFASTSELTPEALRETALLAVRIARASATASLEPVALAPVEAAVDVVRHTAKVDPFEVPLEQRISLLMDCDAEMAGVEGVRVREGYINLFRQRQLFRSSEGASISEERLETGAGLEATAVAPDGSETQRRSYPSSHGGQMGTRGWELVEELDLKAHAREIAEEAVQLLSAEHCPPEETDIILHGGQLALQLHESCGHPIELDRVLGTEASYAGTSFLTTDKLDDFRYGSEAVTITADATLPGGLGSFGYDDEGVPGQRDEIVTEGMFKGYITSRETAPRIGRVSNGAMRADGWNRIPLIRMTNINLEPGDWTLDEIIADTKRGLLMGTNTSWSIDDKRLNFQFGVEVAYRIEDGVLTKMVRNATYNGITPEFWGSVDAVGKDDWMVWGVPNCGKGEPGQSAHVGHGVSSARFRKVRTGVMGDDER